MSDLIDRQAAIDALLHNQEIYSNNFGTDAIDKYTIAIIDNDVQTIAQLPSAQSEIIRCKNCAKRKYCRTSTVWAVPPNDDWYCADAAPYKGEKINALPSAKDIDVSNKVRKEKMMSDLISREAAIDALGDIHPLDYNGQSILEKIKSLPSAEEMAFNEWCTDCKEYDREKGCCPRFNRVIEETVKEVREEHQGKHGRWIKNERKSKFHIEPVYICSCCREQEAWGQMELSNYCPNCGARMEGEEDDGIRKT